MDGPQIPTSVSTDGRWLYYDNLVDGAPPDVWRLPLDGDGEPEAVVATPAREGRGRISADGRYLAFNSAETGRMEVYVLDLETGRRWNVSASGGGSHAWSPVGNELMYLWSEGLWLVEFSTEDGFEPDVARLVRPHPAGRIITDLTLSSDGARELARFSRDLAAAQMTVHIDVVLNWFQELNERAPRER